MLTLSCNIPHAIAAVPGRLLTGGSTFSGVCPQAKVRHVLPRRIAPGTRTFKSTPPAQASVFGTVSTCGGGGGGTYVEFYQFADGTTEYGDPEITATYGATYSGSGSLLHDSNATSQPYGASQVFPTIYNQATINNTVFSGQFSIPDDSNIQVDANGNGILPVNNVSGQFVGTATFHINSDQLSGYVGTPRNADFINWRINPDYSVTITNPADGSSTTIPASQIPQSQYPGTIASAPSSLRVADAALRGRGSGILEDETPTSKVPDRVLAAFAYSGTQEEMLSDLLIQGQQVAFHDSNAAHVALQICAGVAAYGTIIGLATFPPTAVVMIGAATLIVLADYEADQERKKHAKH